VLLVDDDPVQLAARQMVLKKAGFDVHVATTAESALALLHSASFRSGLGLIITDHIMPQLSGTEFVKTLRGITSDTPIIVISGLVEAEEEYAPFGDVEFRLKPVNPPDLIELVRSKLE
jgi:CheY-like chemotaxis protein